MNEFENCEQSISAEDLEAVERSIGYPLPAEFSAHYLKWNGGKPLRDTFYDESGEGDTIAHVYPVKHCAKRNDDPKALLDGHYQYMLQKGVIPKNLLPFASDWGGNFFCIDLQSGAVVFYATDAFSPDASQAENFRDAQRKLSPSFSEFIDALEEGDM